MDPYQKTYETIWADMDPNRHMRHSGYNDYATQTRVAMFKDFGLSFEEIANLGLGPVLFREETKFYREIALSESITVTCELTEMQKDGSRWTFQHNIFKEDKSMAAHITVEGAWLDLSSHKLGIPGNNMLEVINRFPRSDDFRWLSEPSDQDKSHENSN